MRRYVSGLTGLLLLVVQAWAQGGVLVFTTTDPPVPIPDDSGGVVSACQSIQVPTTTETTPVRVRVRVDHTWAGDLMFQLQGPASGSATIRHTTAVDRLFRLEGASGTLTLLNRPGRTGTGPGADDDLSSSVPITFGDDAESGVAAESMGAGCGGTIGQTSGCPDNYLPSPDPLDVPFPGVGTSFADAFPMDAQGAWTLCAADSAPGEVGTLVSWSLVTFPGGIIPVELMSFTVE